MLFMTIYICVFWFEYLVVINKLRVMETYCCYVILGKAIEISIFIYKNNGDINVNSQPTNLLIFIFFLKKKEKNRINFETSETEILP